MDEELLHDAHAIQRDGSAAPESLSASPEQILAELESEGSPQPRENNEDSDEATMQTDTDRSGPTLEPDAELPSADNTLRAKIADATMSMVGSLISNAAAASNKANHDVRGVHSEQEEDIEDASMLNHSTLMSRASSRQSQHHQSLSVPSSPRVGRTQSRRKSVTTLSSPSYAFTPLHGDGDATVNAEDHRLEQLRRVLRPRARSGSHPDLLALVDSYDKSPMECKTVLWRTDEL